MELQSALENRKSIRSYLSKDVEPEKLTALIEAASLAPSWKNSQTARYYVIHTPEKLEQIRATLPERFRTTVVIIRAGACSQFLRLNSGRVARICSSFSGV